MSLSLVSVPKEEAVCLRLYEIWASSWRAIERPSDTLTWIKEAPRSTVYDIINEERISMSHL